MSPFTRFHNLDEDKQRRIMDAALEEFVAHGYEGASLNRIIQQSEMSKGSFYYYFEDKADLLVTILRRELPLGQLLGQQVLSRVSDAAQFWGAFDQTLREGILMVQANPALMRLGQLLHALPQGVRDRGEVAIFMHELAGYAAAWIERGQQLGAVRDDMPTAVLVRLWTSVEMILDQWAFEAWEESDDPQRQALLDVSLALFRRIFSPASAP